MLFKHGYTVNRIDVFSVGCCIAVWHSCLCPLIRLSLFAHVSVWNSVSYIMGSNSLFSLQTQWTCSTSLPVYSSKSQTLMSLSFILTALCSVSFRIHLSEPQHALFFHLCVLKAGIALFIMKIDLVSMTGAGIYKHAPTHTHKHALITIPLRL